jgi:hypothetical protein
MKHLSIFIALMLITTIVQAEKISTSQSDKIVSPLTIAKDLIVQNTIKKVIEKGLNKSPVDLEPDRFHILNSSEHNENYRDSTTAVEYYPLSKPSGPASALTPANVRSLKRPALYHLDRKAYYGRYKKHRSIDPLEVDGQIKVPVVYMDLEDFKATQEQLENLQDRLSKAEVFIPEPNGNFDGNNTKKVYEKDFKPYYNPMTLEKKNGQEYLKQAINKVEMMLNKDERINPKNPPIFTRIASKKVSYQNKSNSEKEDSSNNMVDNYYYATTDEELAKKKAEEKKKQDDAVNKAKNANVKPDPPKPTDRKNEKVEEKNQSSDIKNEEKNKSANDHVNVENNKKSLDKDESKISSQIKAIDQTNDNLINKALSNKNDEKVKENNLRKV